MKSKQIVLLLAALLLAALVAAGCAGSNGEGEQPAQGGNAETGGVEFGEEVEEGMSQGSVEEGGELGDIEVTSDAGIIAPTAELSTPEAAGEEGGAEIGGVEAPVVVGQVDESGIQYDEGAEPPYVTFNTVEALLREQDMTVEELGEQEGADFALTTKRLTINGDEALAFEFESTADAEDAAASMTGGEMDEELGEMIEAEQHVFQEGNVVLVYAGGDEDVYGAISAIFGPEVGLE